MFGACLFLLIQIVLLIEFAYEWNESWVAKWHGDTFQENKNWYAAATGSGWVGGWLACLRGAKAHDTMCALARVCAWRLGSACCWR